MKNNLIGFFISLILHSILLIFFIQFNTPAPLTAAQNEKLSHISLNDFMPKLEPKHENLPEENEIVKEQIVEKIVPKKPKQKPKIPQKINKTEQITKQDQNATPSEQTPTQPTSQAPTKDKNQDEIFAKIGQLIAQYAIKRYPNDAKKRRQQGLSIIQFSYKKNGIVDNIKVISGKYDSLNNAVIKAIEKTKHKFPKINTDVVFEVPVRFELK